MRIIHTSDWHLGQYFYGKSRAAEHEAFMAWLLDQIDTNQVDALIVAGDIFDTGTPPSYARALYNQFIVQIQQTGCKLIILGGNHDSVSTLNESRHLLACLNTTVIPGAFEQVSEHVLPLKSRQGELGAILCGLPYLRPRDIVLSESGESSTDKQHKLGAAISDLYQRCFEQATVLNASLSSPVPIIATGHLTTVGASTSESVRDIYIGSLDAFNAAHFPPADYIALGHIHRPQVVAKSEHIRYSGSPIALSFDELTSQNDAKKSVFLVEFTDNKLAHVTPLMVPMFQAMQVLKGDLDSIAQQLNTFAANAQGTATTWLSIEVSQQDYLSDLQSRIADMTQDKAVEVLQLKRARSQRQQHIKQLDNETLSELSVNEVFARRLAQEQFDTPSQQAQLARMKQQFSQVVSEVESEINQQDSAASHVLHESMDQKREQEGQA
ncbi:exonuclease subunit SbcD [Shewanella inventionis]|uniref:Nuclease SbcCD subunit D n=1 Tax=Shewanella inventionis TaxID=1738770 RepID=A0ABQ1IS92_9GAMM|nr:exonuclease subunit SbcD [Shewanella inventionis]MCL1156849.1 exonuclease subunit SbcD [Shewanella inventionis]GGB51250.1 nuclease SbcCD subunit D [Shewanella inventionis]